MNNNLKPIITALVKKVINQRYDALSGMQIKSGRYATEEGSQSLNASIYAAKMRDVSARRNLRQATFDIQNISMPPVPDGEMTVTAVEIFCNLYDTAEFGETHFNGRNGHAFTLVIGADGDWVVDDYRWESMEERQGFVQIFPGSTSIGMRTSSFGKSTGTSTSLHAGTEAGSATSIGTQTSITDSDDASTRRKNSKYSKKYDRIIARKRFMGQVYKLIGTVLVLGTLAYAAFGPRGKIEYIDLYCGRTMTENIWYFKFLTFKDIDTPNVSQWAENTFAQPPPLWLMNGGEWRPMGISVEKLQYKEDPFATGCMEILTNIHEYGKGDQQYYAGEHLKEYQMIISRAKDLYKEAARAKTLKERWTKQQHASKEALEKLKQHLMLLNQKTKLQR